VKKGKLGRYLILSILLHLGMLLAVNAFLGLPVKVEPTKIIPIEAVVLEEEAPVPETKPVVDQPVERGVLDAKSETSVQREGRARTADLAGPAPTEGRLEPVLKVEEVPGLLLPASSRAARKSPFETKSEAAPEAQRRSDLASLSTPRPREGRLEPTVEFQEIPKLGIEPLGQEGSRTSLETKSPLSSGTEARLGIRDLAGPVPKQGNFEPSLSVRQIPTPGVLPVSREGKQVASRRVVSTSDKPRVYLTPVKPSLKNQPSILEIEVPRTLTEAERSRGQQAYSQTVKRSQVPLGRNRPSERVVSELPPIPTVESPVVPEQREMTLATSTVGPSLHETPEKTGRLKRLKPAGEAKSEPSYVPELPPIATGESPVVPEQREMTLATSSKGAPVAEMLEKAHGLRTLKPARGVQSLGSSVSELSPLPTEESPLVPHQGKMAAAPARRFPQIERERFEKAGKPRATIKTRVALTSAAVAVQPALAPPRHEPAFALPRLGGSFPAPGSPKGAAFLFVLDTSGSVKGAPLEGIKRSALDFIRLMGANDRAGILTFNDSAELVRDFTAQKKSLEREISRLKTAGRRTVLFDALMEGIRAIRREDRQKKVLILFSDGKDEGSRSTLQEVVRAIRRSGVSVLAVGYSRVERKYLHTLQKIAGETGGVFADAPRFRDVLLLFKTTRNAEAR